MTGQVVAAPETPATSRLHGWRMSATGSAGIFALTAIVLGCLIGALFLDTPTANVGQISQPPSSAHWLGTDFAGRDNLALVIEGAPDMLLLAGLAGIVTALIALLMAAASVVLPHVGAYAALWVIDFWLTLPRFVLLIVIAAFARIESTVSLALILAAFSWPALARQLRSELLSVRSRDFVEAARLLDLGPVNIVIRHMLPSLAPFIIVATIQSMTQAIYQQVGLAFLGLVPLRDNWGVLFSTAYDQNVIYSPDAAWALLAPVGAIVLLQVSLVFASRGLEEYFSPDSGRRS